MLMIVAWVNASSPSCPISAPMRDCFAPALGREAGDVRRIWEPVHAQKVVPELAEARPPTGSRPAASVNSF